MRTNRQANVRSSTDVLRTDVRGTPTSMVDRHYIPLASPSFRRAALQVTACHAARHICGTFIVCVCVSLLRAWLRASPRARPMRPYKDAARSMLWQHAQPPTKSLRYPHGIPT